MRWGSLAGLAAGLLLGVGLMWMLLPQATRPGNITPPAAGSLSEPEISKIEAPASVPQAPPETSLDPAMPPVSLPTDGTLPPLPPLSGLAPVASADLTLPPETSLATPPAEVLATPAPLTVYRLPKNASRIERAVEALAGVRAAAWGERSELYILVSGASAAKVAQASCSRIAPLAEVTVTVIVQDTDAVSGASSKTIEKSCG